MADVPMVLAGTSPAMRELVEQMRLVAARSDTPVLLLGEAGVGKGTVAAAIHHASARAAHPFVSASALGTAGVEADALRRARERAAAGSVFLAEVGRMGRARQRDLMGWLDPARTPPDGIPRVIASESGDLVAAVNEGAFDEELYYRLAAMPLTILPLRARPREDLQALVGAMLTGLAEEIPGAPRDVTPQVMDRLVSWPWPGNAREMRNVLERAVLAARGFPAAAWEHLPVDLRDPLGSELEYVPKTLEEVERVQIERALRAHGQNRTRAAAALGISRATLIKKIRQFGLGARTR